MRRLVANAFNVKKYDQTIMNVSTPTSVVGFIIAQVLCFATAGIGGLFTANAVQTWYREITKPAWNPPDWVFGPVWTVLYAMMGVAVWLVWRSSGWAEARIALALFGIQLLLNAAWSAIFFGARSPGFAFGEILVLCCAIVATIVAFWPHSKVASILLVPYLAWSTFAAILNFTIWRIN